jgi:hypothetical protein
VSALKPNSMVDLKMKFYTEDFKAMSKMELLLFRLKMEAHRHRNIRRPVEILILIHKGRDTRPPKRDTQTDMFNIHLGSPQINSQIMDNHHPQPRKVLQILTTTGTLSHFQSIPFSSSRAQGNKYSKVYLCKAKLVRQFNINPPKMFTQEPKYKRLQMVTAIRKIRVVAMS